MRFRSVLFGVVVCMTSGGFFACGSRSALPGDIEAIDTNGDDTGTDARARRDTGPDTSLPPIDATPPFDANRNDCPDADATLVYVMTDSNQLLSFYPADGSFTLIGNIACPAGTDINGNPATPFSMAVDRKGVAYVEFNDDELFKVSTLTAACAKTGFVGGQHGFSGFGMSFSTNAGGPAETLYVAGGVNLTNGGNGNPDLGSIDVSSFLLTDIGPFTPQIEDGELAGTGDGRLFAFWPKDPAFVSSPGGSPSAISEIDKGTGDLTSTDDLPGVIIGGGTNGHSGWAFGFWGGKFYTFTSADGPSTVNEFDPVTKTLRSVAAYPGTIVGAGVSTCAPQQ